MRWTRIEETADCHLCSFIKFPIKQCKEFISHWIIYGTLLKNYVHLQPYLYILFAGIVGLQHLPVSIARLCALNLSFVQRERTYLFILNVKYFCSLKVVRILLKNLSFPVSPFLICINWFISIRWKYGWY